MKKITNRAFTMIEMLLVIIILGILVLIIPNLDLFYLNAVKKEGVLLVRTIIEQERIYKADNGDYYTVDNSDEGKAVQNWRPVKSLLVDNKYFNAEPDSDGKIGYSDSYDVDGKFSKVILNIKNKTCGNDNCRLEVEVKASPKSRAKGWHVRGHLIEGHDGDVKNKKGKEVVSTIKFEEGQENSSKSVESWQEIAL